MRPKKVVALTGFSEDRTALLRFVLRVHGREVRVFARPGDVIQRAKRGGVDLLLSGSDPHVAKVKDACGWLPVILLHGLPSAQTTRADRVYTFNDLSMIDMMEAMRMLLARKRGPRPSETRAA